MRELSDRGRRQADGRFAVEVGPVPLQELERGRIFNDSGQYDQAIAAGRWASEVFLTNDDAVAEVAGVIRFLAMLARVETGDFLRDRDAHAHHRANGHEDAGS